MFVTLLVYGRVSTIDLSAVQLLEIPAPSRFGLYTLMSANLRARVYCAWKPIWGILDVLTTALVLSSMSGDLKFDLLFCPP